MSGLLNRLGARAIGRGRPVHAAARLPFGPPTPLAQQPAPSTPWSVDSRPVAAVRGTGVDAARGGGQAPGSEPAAAVSVSPDTPVHEPAPVATSRRQRTTASGAPAHAPRAPGVVGVGIPSAAPSIAPDPGGVPVAEPTSGAVSRSGDEDGATAAAPPLSRTNGTPGNRARTARPPTPIAEAPVEAERDGHGQDVQRDPTERTLPPGQRFVIHPPKPLLPPPAATPADRPGGPVGTRVPVDGRRDGAAEKTTEVQVTIGRVEVTAVRESAPAIPRRERRSRHTMTLDEYLARRRAEQP